MVYMYHSFLIHLSADGHLGCFHVLAMVNSAAMNTGVHMSLSDLVSLVCMPRSGIAGSVSGFVWGLYRGDQVRVRPLGWVQSNLTSILIRGGNANTQKRHGTCTCTEERP